jgi:hypothetical protein
MKFFMFVLVGALVAGGIYHTEISEYFDSLGNGASGSGGGSSFAGSFSGVGNSSNGLMQGVGGGLKR